jgi:copper(I)-binding protein
MSHIELDAARWTSVLALVIACAPGDRPVHIEYAAVTLDILGAPAATYFTVRDEGSRPDSITALAVDAARSASMRTPQPHRSPMSGMSSAAMMLPVTRVPIGARGTVRFAPGGYTGMLYGLQRTLAPGDSVRLTVQLVSGRTASVMAPVLAYADLEAALGPAPSSAGTPVEPSIGEGVRLYRSNGCASCHGAEGHGDGPVGRALVPSPRDFRQEAAFKAGTDTESIALTLAVGVPEGGSMPLYAHLTNHERRSLARYVISLRTPTPDRTN